jgi:hypothetical protein
MTGSCKATARKAKGLWEMDRERAAARVKPWSGTQTYSPDGTATGTYLWNNKDAGTYTVQWSVKNDMYCSVTVTRDSKPVHDPESCLKVYVKDGIYYFLNADDRLHGLSTITR